jgi:ketosteroid isomerase-like protein
VNDIGPLVAFFETMTAGSVGSIGAHYASDACFKDPFNEVRGVEKIRRVFAHMFEQVADPAFRVTDRIVAPNGAFLAWDFTFRLRPGGELLTVRGSSHLRFDAGGKVAYHCDYWDAAGELYAKVPVLGALMRLLRRKLSAPQ